MTGLVTPKWLDCITGVTFPPSHRLTSALGTAPWSHVSNTTCLFQTILQATNTTPCSRGQATVSERSVTAKLLRAKVHNLIRQRSFYAATYNVLGNLNWTIIGHFTKRTCIRQFRHWNHAGSHSLWIHKLTNQWSFMYGQMDLHLKVTYNIVT